MAIVVAFRHSIDITFFTLGDLLATVVITAVVVTIVVVTIVVVVTLVVVIAAVTRLPSPAPPPGTHLGCWSLQHTRLNIPTALWLLLISPSHAFVVHFQQTG